MKKYLTTSTIVLIVFLTCTAFVIKYSTGKTSSTGAPSEGNCAVCHAPPNPITASGLTITSVPNFTSNQYLPGATYTINVMVGAVTYSNFGFDCVILNSANMNAGIMQNAGAGVQFLTGLFNRKNATHTVPKSGVNMTMFSFEWVAPTSGSVTIYATGVAANLNGNSNGDIPISNTLALTPNTSTSLLEKTTSRIIGLSIFPNPANSFINLSYSLNDGGPLELELISITGQKVANLSCTTETSGLHQQQIKIPYGLASGIYFIRLSLNGSEITQRLISIH